MSPAALPPLFGKLQAGPRPTGRASPPDLRKDCPGARTRRRSFPLRDNVQCARRTQRRHRSQSRQRPTSSFPVYISWTLDEDSGRRVYAAVSPSPTHSSPSPISTSTVFLFNCTYPEAIESGLRQLKTMTDKPIGGYPNRYHVPEGWTLGQSVTDRSEHLSTRLFVEGANTRI